MGLGMQKVRLTGGEPLLRQQLEKLVERLASIPGIADLAMTSNGFLFRQKGNMAGRACGASAAALIRWERDNRTHGARRPGRSPG